MKHSWFEMIAGMVTLACAVGFFLYATGFEAKKANKPSRHIFPPAAASCAVARCA